MAPYESGATGDDYVTLEAVHIFSGVGMSANLGQICGHFLTIIVIILLNDTLFKIFGEVGAYAFAGTLYQPPWPCRRRPPYPHQFGERCLLRVPAEFLRGPSWGRPRDLPRRSDGRSRAIPPISTLPVAALLPFSFSQTFPAQFDADVGGKQARRIRASECCSPVAITKSGVGC